MPLTKWLNRTNLRRLFGLFWFDFVWFAAVFGRNDWLLFSTAMVAAQCVVAAYFGTFAQRRFWPIATLLFVLGLALELTVVGLGIIRFDGGVMPLWLVVLWVGFVLMCLTTLDGFGGRPWLAALLGLGFGPVTYAVGVEMQAAELLAPVWQLWVIYAALWAVYMVIFAKLVVKVGEPVHEPESSPNP